MGFNKGIENFVLKLQNLSDSKKKAIFFTTIALVTLLIGFFGVISTKKNIIDISKSFQAMNFSKVDIPKFNLEIPGINDIRNADLDSLKDSLQESILEDTTDGNEEIINSPRL